MSDELTSVLRELATEGERPPALTGAEIRGRAKGRRRRRRTALAAAGVSVTGALALVVAVSLGGGARHESPPAASPTAVPSPSPAAPDATIDLGTRVISVDGHRLTLNGDNLTGYTPTVRTTVAAKEAHLRFSGKTIGLDDSYSFMATWVIELDRPDGTKDYVGAMPHDGGVYSSPHGWIGLETADAKLLYERLAPGAVVEIRPSSGASASSSAPANTGPPESGTGTPGG
ncbi:L,D-transpeptidase [Streptomyces triticiradicis]|uniref:L,D-transpeptidase n=1 Tax=Streptomyces triticiradicis TaxID=2651189 RepID=UPI001788CD7D|nr:L,D-transpeptidase [Streptomyces triticiradicis]